MPEHTPGPWTVGQYTPTAGFRAIENHACVCDANTRALIAVCGRADDRQSQVDADLIAAAPDLLPACLDLLIAVTAVDAASHPKLEEARSQAHAAIARARGDLPPAAGKEPR